MIASPLAQQSPPPGVEPLGEDVVDHLDHQLASARRLLAIVLRQGAAVRRRAATEVIATMSEIQQEMALRARLETERGALLARIAALLGLSAAAVTAEQLAAVLPGPLAGAVTARSGELRGLLSEVAAEHRTNRALMRQELAFVDHLVRLMGGDSAPAYTRSGSAGTPVASAGSLHVLDARA